MEVLKALVDELPESCHIYCIFMNNMYDCILLNETVFDYDNSRSPKCPLELYNDSMKHKLSKDCWCNPTIVTRSGHEYKANEKKCFNCSNYAYNKEKHHCSLYYNYDVPIDVIDNSFDACELWEANTG